MGPVNSSLEIQVGLAGKPGKQLNHHSLFPGLHQRSSLSVPMFIHPSVEIDRHLDGGVGSESRGGGTPLSGPGSAGYRSYSFASWSKTPKNTYPLRFIPLPLLKPDT